VRSLLFVALALASIAGCDSASAQDISPSVLSRAIKGARVEALQVRQAINFGLGFLCTFLFLAILVSDGLTGCAEDYSGCQMGRGVVLGVASLAWLVHIGALLWWARHDINERFHAVFLRCSASAVLVIFLFAGILSLGRLADEYEQNGVGTVVLIGIALSVIGATAVAFWRFARPVKLR